jgi:polysaccharide chain length determinant protein (PEP-CTERM system associated)
MNLPALARRYAAAGWRHRWKALLLAWLICLPGWVVVYSLPSQYQSNARIYADPEALLGSLLRGLAADSTQASQVDMLQRTLLSRPNLERVIARTDLDLRVHDVASRDALIQDLTRSIRLTPQTRQLFRIDYTDRDPRLAQAVVQTVVTLFLESAASSDRQQVQSARVFLNQQITTHETQLREAEMRRADFMSRFVDILPSAGGGASKLEQSRLRLIELRGNLQDANLRRDVLRQQLEATPASLAEAQAASGGGGGGNPRLAQAEQQLRELRLRLTDQHPDVVMQRAIIAELRASGGGGSTAARPQAAPRGGLPNPLYEQIRLRLVDQDGLIASLERQIRDETAQSERLERLARTAPQVAAELQNMDRDYDIIRRNYETLLQRREALEIAGAARNESDRMRIEVIEPPIVPTAASGPNRLLFAAGVLAAGIGAGAALVLLLIQLDRGFYTTHDLRALGLPVLGGISSAAPPRGQAGAAAMFAGGFAMLLLVFGAMLARGETLVAKMPGLVARFIT